MARMTVWLVALLLTCTSGAAAALPGGVERQERPERAVQDAKAPHGKDKAQPAAANRPRDDRWKWWIHGRDELGITDQQSATINEIFEATVPGLRAAGQELERAEEELSRTIKEHKADIAVVSLQLDRVESARSHYNKTRTLMLYRIHALLSPEQRVKLEALRARQNASRGDRPSQPGR